MRTLIVYATKYGSTEKCALKLSEKLVGEVELHNLKEKRSIDIKQYDKVIIGGSVYVGKIRKEVSEFCKDNLNQLKEKKIGLFTCGMRDGDFSEEQLNSSFPQELLTSAIVKEALGGEFLFDKMNFFERFIVKKVSKNDKNSEELKKNKNVSTISEKSINQLAQLMNNA